MSKGMRSDGLKNYERIRAWFKRHPGGKQTDCSRDLGLSENAVCRHIKRLRAEYAEDWSRDSIDRAAIERLAVLYTKHGRDFDLRVWVSLTEPTCPTAIVQDDDGEIIARADRGTIEEAINVAVGIACARLLDGKDVDVWPDAKDIVPGYMSRPKGEE